MSAVLAQPTPRFLRKTTLREAESNTNFKMLDNDIGEAITSAEADKVTPLMSKIYTRLLLSPDELRESDRVLRFAGQEREGKWVTAWEQLCQHLRVSSETANKALRWLHEQGIIGYYAGKNGVGIRIFLNRAASSVAQRTGPRAQKFLAFGRTSDEPPRTSLSEVPFKDSFAVSEDLETDINPRAPKSGADTERTVRTSSVPHRHTAHSLRLDANTHAASTQTPPALSLDDMIARLRTELEPAWHAAARLAAAREHERTREWLEKRGLPKAARVAQHEAYNILRQYGLVGESARGGRARANVGESDPVGAPTPHASSPAEIEELAGACIALLETRGQSVERTISEMSVAAGGFLLPADASRVREKVNSLLSAGTGGEGN